MNTSGNVWRRIFAALFLRKRHEWRAVVACLLAAGTIWLLNALNKDYVTVIAYPIKLEYDSEHLAPVNDLPRTIDLNVSANGWRLLMRTFWFSIPPLVYAPSGLPATKFITAYQLLPVAKEQLPELDVNYIVTDSIYTDFSYLATKRIKVVIDSAGISLAPGYRRLGPLHITPDCVEVHGASVALAALSNRFTLQLKTRNLDDNYEEVVPVNLPRNRLIKPVNKEVLVAFAVGNGRFIETLLPVRFENCSGFDTVLMARFGYMLPRDSEEKAYPPDSFLLRADCQRREHRKVHIDLARCPAKVTEIYTSPEYFYIPPGGAMP